MKLSKYRRIGKEAIDKYLQESSEHRIPLYQLSAVADKAAYKAGKKYELFNSLFDYVVLLPSGAKTFWEKKSGFYSVTNPYNPGPVEKGYFFPGPFDAAVDMGPDFHSARLR